MRKVLYFGGSSESSQSASSVDIDTLNAWQFCSDLDYWVGAVHAVSEDAPVIQEELATFDKIRLVPRFRVDYAAGKVSARRGWTLEEGFLALQLELQQVAEALIVRDYADQPSGRISRKRYFEADELSSLLAHNLRNWSEVRIPTFVTDGRFAHTIALAGVSTDGKSVRYLDPWPGGSLLCADQNAAGVNALPDPVNPLGWIVDLRGFARVLVGVFLPEAYRRFWKNQFTDSTESGTSFDPFAQWDGSRPRNVDSSLASRIATLSANPGSRHALASAALALAAAVKERGLTDETLHWLRQAAYTGHMPAAEVLQKQLNRLNQQHNDPSDGFYTVARQAVLSGDNQTSGMFPSFGEPPREHWQRRQRQFEADYWGRQAALAREMRNPWAIEVNLSEKGADTSLPTYQMVEPLKANELEDARELADGGDLEGARRLFEEVISTGHPTAAPEAANELGIALLESGDAATAADLFRRATLSCDLGIGPWAACSLGNALEKLHKFEDALAAYERAIYSCHRDAAPASQINFGRLCYERGSLLQAVDAFMQAAISDHPIYGPIGFFSAGLVYKDVNSAKHAKALFEQVLRFPESEYSKRAQDLLRKLDPGTRAAG